MIHPGLNRINYSAPPAKPCSNNKAFQWPACQPYRFWWLPLDVSTGGVRGWMSGGGGYTLGYLTPTGYLPPASDYITNTYFPCDTKQKQGPHTFCIILTIHAVFYCTSKAYFAAKLKIKFKVEENIKPPV